MFVAAVAMGVDLLKLRDVLGHGHFGPLLKREFQWTQKTAENYMKLARHFADIIEPFSDLNLTTARALVATSTPAVIRDELLARAKAGETISCEEVRQRIVEAKDAEQKPTAKSKQVAADRAVDTEVGPSAELPSRGELTIGRRTVFRQPVPPPTVLSPAEQLAEALLNLSFDIRKSNSRRGPPGVPGNSPHCDPYDVAMVLMEPEHQDRIYDLYKCAEYVQDVSRALFGMQASPELLKINRRSKQ